jgi:probable phosphoglycerate mutase
LAGLEDFPIYLLRHGKIQGSEVIRFIGQMDVPLDEIGLGHAEAARRYLADKELRQVFTSELSRTRVSADIVLRGRDVPVRQEPAFNEIDTGEWTGIPLEQIKVEQPEIFAAREADRFSFRHPGGESFADLAARVVPAFTHIAESAQGPTLIVAHLGVIRTILAHVLGMPPRKTFGLHIDYGGLSIVQAQGGERKVSAVNKAL